MLSNVSLLNLRARRRTLGCTRDITRARLIAWPMSNRRARGRRVWSLAITRTPADLRPYPCRHEGPAVGWTNKQLAWVWTEGVDPIRKKYGFEYIQTVSKRFWHNRVNLQVILILTFLNQLHSIPVKVNSEMTLNSMVPYCIRSVEHLMINEH